MWRRCYFCWVNPQGHNIHPLLFTAYFPPVSYGCLMIRSQRIIIDTHETFPKQTYRNRCHIYGANGLLSLVVPVVKPNGNHTATQDILIDYSGNWVANHLRAIEAAYSSSPFFEYFIDDITSILKSGTSLLVSLNELIFRFMCDSMSLPCTLEYTQGFIPPCSYTGDYRQTIHPKPSRRDEQMFFTPQPYYQVFAAKYGFLPDLSILDLLMNEGPQAPVYLRKSSNF